MTINFSVKGRLGNAIFRYMACAVICIITNNKYNHLSNGSNKMTDEQFFEISTKILNGEKLHLQIENCNMSEYYQHDQIYIFFKQQIINFVKNNPSHIITTDGISAGDNNCQSFKIFDIVNTSAVFKKKYKNVLHLRLEDFVIHNLHIPVERIIKLLSKNIITDDICIVCKHPTTDFENNYIQTIKTFIQNQTPGIKIIIEHNDILTDYYIMKEAETLICSKSTLSWCAAFFSTTIKACFLPDYVEQPKIMTCKKPIHNTILY